MSDMMSLLVLLTDLRCALGDNGLRMQPELVEYARELKAKADEADRLRAELDIATHKVICCGVAASHPDPGLTTSGAYADKWDSPQAEAVRALRRERDRLRAASAWQPIETAPKVMPRVYLVANAKCQVAPHIGGVIHNTTGSAWDWHYGEAVTHWQPLPAPPEAA